MEVVTPAVARGWAAAEQTYIEVGKVAGNMAEEVERVVVRVGIAIVVLAQLIVSVDTMAHMLQSSLS